MPKLNPNEPVQWWDDRPPTDTRDPTTRDRWHKDNKLAPPGSRAAKVSATKIAKRGWTDEEMIAAVVTRNMSLPQAAAEFGRTGVRIRQILTEHGYVLGWHKPGN